MSFSLTSSPTGRKPVNLHTCGFKAHYVFNTIIMFLILESLTLGCILFKNENHTLIKIMGGTVTHMHVVLIPVKNMVIHQSNNLIIHILSG